MLWDVVKRLCGVCVATDQVLIRASGELNRWPHVWNNGRPGVEAQVTGYKEWSYSGVDITQWARYTSLDSSVCRAKDCNKMKRDILRSLVRILLGRFCCSLAQIILCQNGSRCLKPSDVFDLSTKLYCFERIRTRILQTFF